MAATDRERPSGEDEASAEQTSEPSVEDAGESTSERPPRSVAGPHRSSSGEKEDGGDPGGAADGGGEVEVAVERQGAPASSAAASAGSGSAETPSRVEGWWRRFDAWRSRLQQPWRSGDSLVELTQAVRRDLERTLEPLGGGRRVFPYAGVVVVLQPRGPEQETLYRAALAEGWQEQLREAVVERLHEAGARLDRLDLEVQVQVEEPEVDPAEGASRSASPGESADAGPAYRLELVPFREGDAARRAASAGGEGDREGAAGGAAPVDRGEATPLRLVVEEGAAQQDVYEFEGGSSPRIAIGRMRDVFDQHGRIRRRNDLAFEDDGEVNGTVSREHAQIAYQAGTDDYWLIDDRSSYGTRIFRDGRAIEVSSRDRRGIRLRQDDRIYLGRAVLRVELGPAAAG